MITFQTWKDLKTLGFLANVLGTAQGIHHEDNIGESEIESCSRGLPEDRANWVRVQTGNQLISKMAVVTTKIPSLLVKVKYWKDDCKFYLALLELLFV